MFEIKYSLTEFIRTFTRGGTTYMLTFLLMSYSRIAFLQHDRMSRPHLPRGGVAFRHNLSSSFTEEW